jgi:hypothetical protein
LRIHLAGCKGFDLLSRPRADQLLLFHHPTVAQVIMKSLSLIAVSSFLSVVDCGFLKWGRDGSSNWEPPKQTHAAEDHPVLGIMNMIPEPTEAPRPDHVAGELLKRQVGSDTCGYISGITSSGKPKQPVRRARRNAKGLFKLQSMPLSAGAARTATQIFPARL